MIKVATGRYLLSTGRSSCLLTGIQPTGNLHIGNYLGSVVNMVKLQEEPAYAQKLLMLADYHCLTTAMRYEHSAIKFNEQIGKNTLKMAQLLLACGFDPSKMCLFVQSQVSQHADLTWIFSCITPQHWLNTMIQYKEKSHENSSIGLYTYPILMAVDILLYQANYVPVGADQTQHLELTNKIAKRFNKQFKTDFFPRVNYVRAEGARVMSLTDPHRKMSKSDSNDRSRINLSDSQEAISEKIRRAVTDSDGNRVSYDAENRPGLANLLSLYSALAHRPISQIVDQCQSEGCGISGFKAKLSSLLWTKLSQIQDNIKKWPENEVKRVLSEGQDKASQIAQKNLVQVRNKLSLYI